MDRVVTSFLIVFESLVFGVVVDVFDDVKVDLGLIIRIIEVVFCTEAVSTGTTHLLHHLETGR